MTLRYLLQDKAAEDLWDAARFLAEAAGPQHVDAFVDEVFAMIDKICEFPGIGTPCSELSSIYPTLRRQRVGRYHYLLFYVADDAVIRIVRLLHPKQDSESAFGER